MNSNPQCRSRNEGKNYLQKTGDHIMRDGCDMDVLFPLIWQEEYGRST